MWLKKLLGISAVIVLWTTIAFGQINMVPGSSTRGAALFVEKGCADCHSFNGKGGTRAPDLAQRSGRAYTPELLASVMWNHGPAMWSELKAKTGKIPDLSSTNVADLYAYFYSILYFRAAGDASRGKAVFEQKGCTRCHSGTGSGIQAGPRIADWGQVKDPLSWAERMWNHSGEMYSAMAGAGLRWPELTTQNTVDLITYFQGLAAKTIADFQPGDPEMGRATFENKCESCHGFGSTLPGKIDLAGRKAAPRNLTDYITSMWNHAPLMHRKSTGTFPKLETGEMPNLVAYLFAQRYFFQQGDIRRGEEVYQKKGCAECHERRRQELHAADLGQSSERFSPLAMTVAVWRHGPSMLEILTREGKAWPQFSGSEMTNLIAYLNSRLIKRIGRGPE